LAKASARMLRFEDEAQVVVDALNAERLVSARACGLRRAAEESRGGPLAADGEVERQDRPVVDPLRDIEAGGPGAVVQGPGGELAGEERVEAVPPGCGRDQRPVVVALEAVILAHRAEVEVVERQSRL